MVNEWLTKWLPGGCSIFFEHLEVFFHSENAIMKWLFGIGLLGGHFAQGRGPGLEEIITICSIVIVIITVVFALLSFLISACMPITRWVFNHPLAMVGDVWMVTSEY